MVGMDGRLILAMLWFSEATIAPLRVSRQCCNHGKYGSHLSHILGHNVKGDLPVIIPQSPVYNDQ